MHGNRVRNRVVALMVICLALGVMVVPGMACAETLRWTKTYNSAANGNDNGYGVAVAKDGSIVVAGGSVVVGQSNNLLLLKYAASGALLWKRSYNGPDSGFDEAYAVAVAPDGSVYACGVTDVAGHEQDFLLLKYAAAGNLLWSRTYNGPASGEDVCYGVAVAPDGSVFATGWLNGGKVLLQKYSPDGVRRWNKVYGEPCRAYSIAIGPDGNIHLSGSCESVGQFGNILVQQYSPAGALRWSKTYNGPDNGTEYAYGLAVGADRNVYVSGSTTVAGQMDLIVQKYSPSGVRAWSKTYAGADNMIDRGQGVGITPDGSIVVAGSTLTAAEGMNVVLRKYSPAGALRWSKTFNGAAGGTDSAFDVAVGSDGSIFLVGDTEVTGQLSNLLLQKYR